MQQLDIKKFKQRAYRKKKKLVKFLNSLKKRKVPNLIKTTLEIDKEVWKETNCLSCANCCRNMTPVYSPADIRRISKHFKMTSKEFFAKWLKKDDEGDVINKTKGCQFIGNDNKCSIYEIRPQDCAEFPHLYKKDFLVQLKENIYQSNLIECPATLVFAEKLEKVINV